MFELHSQTKRKELRILLNEIVGDMVGKNSPKAISHGKNHCEKGQQNKDKII